MSSQVLIPALPFSSTSWEGREPDKVTVEWEDGDCSVYYGFVVGPNENDLYGVMTTGAVGMDSSARIRQRFSINEMEVEEYFRYDFWHYRFVVGGKHCQIFSGHKRVARAALEGLLDHPTKQFPFTRFSPPGVLRSVTYGTTLRTELWHMDVGEPFEVFYEFGSYRNIVESNGLAEVPSLVVAPNLIEYRVPYDMVGRLYTDGDAAALCGFSSLSPALLDASIDVVETQYRIFDTIAPAALAEAMKCDALFRYE